MAASDKLFAGSIPEIYDRFLVPLIFESCARDLAARLARAQPRDVLETAAGTGVSRATRVTASGDARRDRSQSADARSRATETARCGPGRMAPGGCIALPFADQNTDAAPIGDVLSRQVRATGRRAACSRPVAGSASMSGARSPQTDSPTSSRRPWHAVCANSPRFLAHPTRLSRRRTIRQQLAAAGFATISIETLDETSRAASPRDPAIAYCQGTPLRNEIETRDPSRLEEATQRAAEALAQRFGSGAIEGRIRAHVVTAVR